MTSVDVVIVSYRSADTLPGSIAAVRSWPRCGRVIVVDNASPDSSAEVAQRLGDVVVVNRENVGFGAAQNQGVGLAATDLVLLLNPDASVDAAGLDAGIAAFDRVPRAAMVEGRIRRRCDGRDERWAGEAPGLRDLVARLLRLRERLGEDRLRRLSRHVGARHYDDRTVDRAQTVDFLAAVAPLVRRRAFLEVGGFDDRIFLYAEDVDLSHRLRQAGWSLLALPVAWADHVGGASSTTTTATRDRLWWTSHRYVVANSWRGFRRPVGLAITGLGLRGATRRLASGPEGR